MQNATVKIHVALSFLLLTARPAAALSDALPSWSDGAAKSAIASFVAAVTKEGGPDYVAPADRIAVFDNDGTLWSEQPTYVQLAFLVDQVKAAAPEHPEWKDNPAFQALMANDVAALRGQRDQVRALISTVTTGMSVEQYDRTIRDWLARARHPTLQRPYTDLAYAPMLELLAYLRANGFKTYIVSGGNIEFIRPWSERIYGIPPEQVIGTIPELKFDANAGALLRQPGSAFANDGPSKPVGIYRAIGKRPILAFGNSDGDQQMLQYVADGPGKRLALLVHHDDGAREVAYDRDSEIGRLNSCWNYAIEKKWTVVSMKNDWRKVYAFEK